MARLYLFFYTIYQATISSLRQAEEKGDGYTIEIKSTFVLMRWNYVTLAITGPDGIGKCSTLPISSIGEQLFKGCKTSKNRGHILPNTQSSPISPDKLSKNPS